MRKLAIALCGMALAIGCGGGDSEEGARPDAGGPTDVEGVTDVKDDDVRADVVEEKDEGKPPECELDDDCAEFFDDLSGCEVAFCDDDGRCQREYVAEESPCEDGDPCSTGDRCIKDPSGVLVCEAEVAGCDDGDICNGVETCGAEGCVPGDPLSCADENMCNGTEGCDPIEGCTPGKPLACPSDGDPCNGAEVCDPDVGCTQGDEPTCDDASDCTTDSCVPNVGCVFEVDPSQEGCCEKDADCGDDNPCTAGTCNEKGACVIANLEGPCDTGDPCATGGTCQSGKCTADMAPNCATLCTLDGKAGDTVDCPIHLAALGDSPSAASLGFVIGYPGAGAKLSSLVDVVCLAEFCSEVGIPQATTSMEPSGHTVFLSPPAPGEWMGKVEVQLANVSDADAAITDASYQGEALEGDASLLILRFELTADVAGADVVLHSLEAAAAAEAALASKLVGDTIVTTDAPCGDDICFDKKPCTKDTCGGGTCSYPFGDGTCDDGNACTIGDACDAEGDCVPTGYAADGAECAGEDKCQDVGSCDGAGVCVMSGQPKQCDPPGPCTTATCDPATGECLFGADIGAICDDENKCTQNDACTGAGSCVGEAIECNDGVGCTTDSCVPATGCVFEKVDSACADPNPCTEDLCTDAGCTHEPVAGPCDDDDACTLEDACKGGVCQGAPDPKCGCTSTAMCAPLDDGNPCNGTIACIGGQCVTDPKTVVKCPTDGFKCKESWTCNTSSGQCEGTEMLCDDGLDCTTDSCKIGEGCINVPTPACPIGHICEISGKKGDTVDCPLRMARLKQSNPRPTAGEVKLHYDEAKVKLTNFVDKLCIGLMCGDILFVSCKDGEMDCKVSQTLKPSGHTLDVLPSDVGSWKGIVQAATFHMTNPSTALSEAYVDGTATAGGDPEYLIARFELLADIDAAEPMLLKVSTPSFPPLSGLPMKVTIQVLDGLRTFVATPQ